MLPLKSCPGTAKWRPSGEGTPQVRELDFSCSKEWGLPLRSTNNRVAPDPVVLSAPDPVVLQMKKPLPSTDQSKELNPLRPATVRSSTGDRSRGSTYT